MSISGIIAVIGICLLLLTVTFSVLSMARRQEEEEIKRQWEESIRRRLREQKERDENG